MFNNIKLVIFDCDGVLFETQKANRAFYNTILQNMGYQLLTNDQFHYAQMHTADETMKFLFVNELDLQEAQAYRKQMSYLPFIKDMEIEPTLKKLIRSIRPPVLTAIATNRTDTMEFVLEIHQLIKMFDLVVTALDVDNPKPAPDMLNKVLDHFSLKSHQTIYIGDSELDERAAKSAKVPFVAFKNESLSADFHIKELMEIRNLDIG